MCWSAKKQAIGGPSRLPRARGVHACWINTATLTSKHPADQESTAHTYANSRPLHRASSRPLQFSKPLRDLSLSQRSKYLRPPAAPPIPPIPSTKTASNSFNSKQQSKQTAVEANSSSKRSPPNMAEAQDFQTSTASHQAGFGDDDEESLTPLEQEVLDEYARLLGNLNNVRFASVSISLPPSPSVSLYLSQDKKIPMLSSPRLMQRTDEHTPRRTQR